MPDRGLNLPPTQGSSNAGAFLPGVYRFDYTADDIKGCTWHGFSAFRLLVNPESAHDDECMSKLKSYLELSGKRGIICMFDASKDDTHGDGHGTGMVSDICEFSSAWRAIHEIFKECADVKYEIFNEPFGYRDVGVYLEDMLKIVDSADLPRERCILNGMGYAGDVRSVADAGWPGLLAYHFYPMWCAEGQRTQENFSSAIRKSLAGLSSRVYITEFGGALNSGDVYETYHADGSGGNVNALRGLHDALLHFKACGEPVRGAYFFHGWHNGDSYDIWAAENSHGKAKVMSILNEAFPDSPALPPIIWPSSSPVEVRCFRKGELAYYVHSEHPMLSRMAEWGWTEEGVSFSAWPAATEPGAVPIHCFRKAEMAFYCHAGWNGYSNMASWGWTRERVAFFAYAPSRVPHAAVRVHLLRKGELAYYCRSDSKTMSDLVACGWEDKGVSFAVPQ